MPRSRSRTDAPTSSQPLPDPRTLQQQFLLAMRMRNCTESTIRLWNVTLDLFNRWCTERSIDCVSGLTPELLAAYRRHLFHYRNAKTGRPLRFSTQLSYLVSVRRWCHWMAKERFLAANPAAELELPKEERRLPGGVLTEEQVERLMDVVDVTTPLGVRNRAILETLYSTAIRASELAQLAVYDLEPTRGVVKVRQGKGRKDRVVPIGPRAMAWIERYLADVRPAWVELTETAVLFVTTRGRPLHRNHLSSLVRGYLTAAGVTCRGACHLLRHTATTLMMEHGADLRSLQLLLGHERLTTTQIYTHVSIQRLQEVHARTHPASRPPERPVPPDSTTG